MRLCFIFRTTIVCILFLLITKEQPVKANEVTTPEIDYQGIQDVLDYALDKEDNIVFEDLINDLSNPQKGLKFSNVFERIRYSIGMEFSSNIKSLLQLLAIAVIAAIFSNFSHTFQNSQIADTGFYVTYLLMFVILSTTFISAVQITSSTLGLVKDFMKALVPTYCMSVAYCTGSVTSVAYYEAILVLITVVNVLLVRVVLPLINLFMMASLANHLSNEDLLSKLADLLSTIIGWVLKTLLAVVIGIGTVQSLLAPAIDQVKRSSLLKTAGAVPGIGGILSGVAETVLGVGVLLKNCIGVGGMIAIITICAVPIVKLALYVLIYKLLAAAIQPISDKRITNCVSACSGAASLLLQTLFVAVILFEIAITIVAVSTMRIT